MGLDSDIQKLAARIAAEIRQGVKPVQDDAAKKLKLIAIDAKLICRAAARIHRVVNSHKSAAFILNARSNMRKAKPWTKVHHNGKPKKGSHDGQAQKAHS